jgi:adenine-specific DNA-methyltransferase
MLHYDDLTREELVRLLEARDRREATRFGLVWEARETDRDGALNDDFVALDLDAGLSCGTAPWRNLIVEGDNYDALRHLRMAFAGRVKCIYIDPPYNTGNRDFVYNDRFVDREDAWRHSKWCDFMYRRLLLAKRLLAPEGAIFVSIDDNEVFTLGLLMQRVFGEGNFVGNVIWQKRTSPDARIDLGPAHDYILVWSRSRDEAHFNRVRLSADQHANYKNPDNDPRGPWTSTDFTAQGWRPNQMYEIVTPGGARFTPPPGRCWSNVEPGFRELVAQSRMWFGSSGKSRPRVKTYLSETEGVRSWTWWPNTEVGHNQEAKKEILDILGSESDAIFSTPKPVRLIERIVGLSTGPDDLVLDFFAGSGTTAHAVHKVNAADGGRRRCILVSNTEATADAPEKNLCRDVCARRVRRVIEGYNGQPGLGGDFAYLRCRRVSAGRLLKLEHEAVWTALQLIHGPTLAPFTVGAPFQISEGDAQTLVYVPRFRVQDAAALRQCTDAVASATICSWQPDVLRQHLPGAHIAHESAAGYLARKFGVL